MLNLTRTSVCSFLMLLALSSCVLVAGRLRPPWRAGWATIDQDLGNCSGANVHVAVFYGNDRFPLPGVRIIAEPKRAGGDSAHHEVNVTDVSGMTSLSLVPGDWTIRGELEGMYSVIRHLRVSERSCYSLKMYTDIDAEPITVVRGLTAHSSVAAR